MSPTLVASSLPGGDPARLYWPQSVQYDPDVCQSSHPHLKQASPAASIDFHPNAIIYEARRDKRLHEGVITQTLPQGWPQQVGGPLVWESLDFKTGEDYVIDLSDTDKIELAFALRRVVDDKLSYDNITPETFPLPALSSKLQHVRDTVYTGIGFVILRGLDVDNYSADDCLRIFLGVSSYIAARRAPQDQLGNILKHLTDYGRVNSDRDLPLHTDMTADVVATMTLKCSDYGGEGTVASAWTVYNELAATRPDLIHVLAEPNWPFDTYGRIPAYYNRALMYYHDEKVIVNFSRRVLVGHPISGRTRGIPGLTEAQAEALDALHFTARKHSLRMATHKGDMRFINNFAILHGRESYSDAEGVEATNEPNRKLSRRHLLRLWLHNERMAWKLPPALQLVWVRGFGDIDRRRTWDEARILLDDGTSDHGGTGPQGPTRPKPNTPAYPCD